MPTESTFEMQLDAVFMAEATKQYGDLETAIRKSIPWVIARVALARCADELDAAFRELEPENRVFRALVGCELLGMTAARPDVRIWLCGYVGGLGPGEGARYQLACAYSRLGAEARRSMRFEDAVEFARKGLDSVSDLPPRAVTANLYYNLGVALDARGDVGAAIAAFEDSADVDDSIGRESEAAQARSSADLLRRRAAAGPANPRSSSDPS